MRRRDLPAALLLAAGIRVVRVQSAGRSTHQPRPRVAEPLGAGSLEGGEPAASGMDVDIDDEYAGGRAGRKSDVRLRCALPPRVDDAGDRGRVVEAVRSQRLLPPGTHGNTGMPRLA